MNRLPLFLTLLMCFGAGGASLYFGVFTIDKVKWPISDELQAIQSLWATYVNLALLAFLVRQRVGPPVLR